MIAADDRDVEACPAQVAVKDCAIRYDSAAMTTPPLPAAPPFPSVLVANRGEIAVRVIRACHELGIAAVAVYGEGEENAVHVRAADDAYRIPAGIGLAYLDIEAMIAVAHRAEAAAIHPGYGFLAENAAIAEACQAAGLVFVGPPAAAIRAMGNKVEARRVAAGAGLPIVPGSEGPVASIADAAAWADRYGYPVAVKAAGGGGGRGFRVARRPAELEEAFAGAAGEAGRFFANPVVYLERYLERPRHVEVQLLADDHGNVVYLGERDCSIQRRHQKLIEEAPAPGLSAETRDALAEAAVTLARAVDYRNAGTVEFLLDGDGHFAFLEMNTRIQVEHPVTEAVTGIDLVKEQIRVAAGRPLSFTAADVVPRGHALECRINAEDAGRDFAPQPGVVTGYREPGGFGIRVDAAMEAGGIVPPAYDSLIAKLIVWGRDRDEAIARMRRALADFVVEGVPTTIPFHRAMMDHPVFLAGEATTTFLSEHPDVLPPPAAAAETREAGETTPRETIAEVNDRRFVVRLFGGPPVSPVARRQAPRLSRAGERPGTRGVPAMDGHDLASPIQGTVLRVAVDVGQPVSRGDVVCVVEAMKMENELTAHRDGAIEALQVAAGDAVKIGDVVAVIR